MSQLNTTFIGRKACLIYGYIRQIENEMTNDIPQDIKYLIISCYPSKLLIVGIGKNFNGQFGLGHETTVDRLRKLPTFSSIVNHYKHIYIGRNKFILQSINGNDIYCVGSNVYNECGLNCKLYGESIVNFTKINHPHFNENNNKNNNNHIITISDGLNSQHTIIYSNDINRNKYRFYISGQNNFGQLSIDNKKTKCVETLIENTILNNIFIQENIIKITCGSLFSLFLTKTGRVYSCGDNRMGSCGINRKINKIKSNYLIKPIQIPFLYDIQDIASGDWHNLCITRYTNKLYVFGSNSFGQLAMHYDDNDDDNDYYDDKYVIDTATKNQYFSDINIIKISCGSCYSLCIDDIGKCYLFGNNNSGQIGNGTYHRNGVRYPFLLQNHRKFNNIFFENGDCGNNHTLLLSKNNNVYCCGHNEYYQCTNQLESDKILIPRLLTRNEIGIKKNQKILRVIAGFETTVIVAEDSC